MATNLKLIGTGFGRTGTDSMRDALEILGLAPCHHMKVIGADRDHCAQWCRAIATNRFDWDILLGGFQACLDWPTAYYWPQLIKDFPDAKVLLTYRDADSWWRSFEKTILQTILNITGKKHLTPAVMLLGPLVFGEKPLVKDHCISVYKDNVARVKREVPAHRLHIHTLGDGWDGLCTFLDTPVPDVPFPHTNTTREYHLGWANRFGENPKS